MKRSSASYNNDLCDRMLVPIPAGVANSHLIFHGHLIQIDLQALLYPNLAFWSTHTAITNENWEEIPCPNYARI